MKISFNFLKVPRKTLRPGFPPAQFRTQNLFSDSDRDGVANVFDCQPNNPRKQDSALRSGFTGRKNEHQHWHACPKCGARIYEHRGHVCLGNGRLQRYEGEHTERSEAH